ncbi:chromosome segregation SMC family protein, partial [Ignavibacterium album]|uniref:chromosome segregation SMC family protein n=1 Tax=Ignavibacterium album TaxID=591197 RepID=UPI0038B4024E
MYLSKLEIFGFKSFAQKTVINFNEGITSIVGPNGCGKTNVVDAIRWCLGEQRSGVLRSDKMENVIFNGTANRKPMGMAEVSLTIQNTKGILPTEYTDVTITRRIFRSGESEYLLNKNLCRLKDITNLFMDTGIGANAYSVIELKMVETILSSKAEERRILFEEAAGVNKYKLRRRLALRKLDEVKADLTRVNDIVSEVEKKVASLERQAKKADKHNSLSTQLRELELDLAEREFALFLIKIDELKQSREENFRRKIQIESDVARLEDEIKDAREKLLIIEAELAEKRKMITEQTDKIYQVQNSLSVKSERKNSLERNKTKYSDELLELENELRNTKDLITNGNSN